MNKKDLAKIKTKLISLLLAFVLIPVFFNFHAQAKHAYLDDGIKNERFSSSQKVHLLIELKDPSTIELYSVPFFSMENSELIQYQNHLKKKHVRLLEIIKNKNIQFHFLGSLCHVLNGLIIETSAYHAQWISHLPYVSRCLLLEDVFELDRYLSSMTIYARPKDISEKQKYSGKNTIVGIIDTGIDYLHEDFFPQGIRSENSKIIDGDDFADDVYENNQLIKDDKDPMDDAVQHSGHGTHVAGIAAGNHQHIPIAQGIAPDASLMAYKVFSSKPNAGGAQGAHIILAVERSIEDECDVINLSLGHRGRLLSEYVDSPYYTVFQRAIDAGVIVVATAGNNGSRFLEDDFDNEWTMSAPGTFDSVIQVAASDDRHFYPVSISLNNSKQCRLNAQRPAFVPEFPEHYKMLEIVDAGYGSAEDFEDLDASNKIALISRGPRDKGISFMEKNLNAKKAGALGCIIYNYDPSPFLGTMVSDGTTENPYSMDFLPTFFISLEGASWIKELIEVSGSIEFPENQRTVIADYTSAGPSPDAINNIFKPEITAPGTSLYSTLPSSLNKEDSLVKWGSRQGTSMAAPVVAGSIAVLKEAKPWLDQEKTRSLLMNTADLLTNPLNGEVFSFFYQGAGQINVANALSSPIIASPPSIMRSYDHLEENVIIEIENYSEDLVYIDLRSVVFSENQHHELITVSMDKPYIQLNPFEKENIHLWFHVSDDASLKKLIEGVIWLDVQAPMNQNVISHSLHVPFVLYHAEKLLDIEKPISNTQISSSEFSMKDESQLQISFNLNSGTQFRTIDKEEKKTISVRNYARIFSIYLEDEEENYIDRIYYAEWLPVGSYEIDWTGKNLKNQWFLENGSFQMVFSIDCYTTIIEDTRKTSLKLIPIAKEKISIKDSPLSKEIPVLISYPGIMEENRSYRLKILCPQAKELNRFETNIVFPNSWDNLLPSSTKENIDIAFEWSQTEANEKILHITAERGSLELSHDNWHIADITFHLRSSKESEAPIISRVNFWDAFSVLRKYNRIHQNKWFFPENKTKKLDFNDDGKIDMQDAGLILLELGRSWKDSSWKPEFDIDGDWVITIEDVRIFARYLLQPD